MCNKEQGFYQSNTNCYLYDELLEACEEAAYSIYNLHLYTPAGEVMETEHILDLIKREIFKVDFSAYTDNNEEK